MAHNPLNDLYVETVEEVSRDTQRFREIAAAICNRDLRRHLTLEARRLPKKPLSKHIKGKSRAHRAP